MRRDEKRGSASDSVHYGSCSPDFTLLLTAFFSPHSSLSRYLSPSLPLLALPAPRPLGFFTLTQLSHWWHQLKFRLQNKKRWDKMLDETFLLHTKLTNDIPLFYVAKTNNVDCIKKLLSSASTNIFERGALGETALHIAVMNDNVEAAVALMDGAPELINEPMTSELFKGVTPLHIAVVNQNISLVHHLISHGGDVATPRATGLYFRKRRGGLIYFGEHVLSFAACTGNENIISMVVNTGAMRVVATILMLERRLPRCLKPRFGECGLKYGLKELWYLRVEDRNDTVMQKMRRYVMAFSKEDEKEKEELEKSDSPQESISGISKLRQNKRPRDKRNLTGWQMIRLSTLGLELELVEPKEDQNIK
uniref:transient receptor potential cation channel subfamily V member 6-like n=1 Tax=Monopterus albus TaxID=43700 RepID=UPI0009B46A0C|nr:transient receptor potential cation channel subfamily V member 6-like [Monopterus albus]